MTGFGLVMMLLCRQTSDLRRSFDERLIDRETEVNLRLDELNRQHDCRLAGALLMSCFL